MKVAALSFDIKLKLWHAKKIKIFFFAFSLFLPLFFINVLWNHISRNYICSLLDWICKQIMDWFGITVLAGLVFYGYSCHWLNRRGVNSSWSVCTEDGSKLWHVYVILILCPSQWHRLLISVNHYVSVRVDTCWARQYQKGDK